MQEQAYAMWAITPINSKIVMPWYLHTLGALDKL